MDLGQLMKLGNGFGVAQTRLELQELCQQGLELCRDQVDLFQCKRQCTWLRMPSQAHRQVRLLRLCRHLWLQPLLWLVVVVLLILRPRHHHLQSLGILRCLLDFHQWHHLAPVFL